MSENTWNDYLHYEELEYGLVKSFGKLANDIELTGGVRRKELDSGQLGSLACVMEKNFIMY